MGTPDDKVRTSDATDNGVSDDKMDFIENILCFFWIYEYLNILLANKLQINKIGLLMT